ncbi:hypothetical protein GDO81_023300 [Engystomops pustulosus]|uniref:Uncharacterized protein n=1 Tax=Engystomops pustulosus TaxID=76066 RepID=A0AAV6ZRS7_ENGPU|nr:hypothetical protein GDO81_023300 [Engystomops pustulosus]
MELALHKKKTLRTDNSLSAQHLLLDMPTSPPCSPEISSLFHFTTCISLNCDHIETKVESAGPQRRNFLEVYLVFVSIKANFAPF